MKPVKNYIKMISPFNDMQEMPSAIYIAKKLLAFLVIYFAAAVSGEAVIIAGLSLMGYDPLHGIMPSENTAALLQYYGFIFFLIIAIIYCRHVEKFSLSSIGFNKHALDYILGAVIAVILLSSIMVICSATGAISYIGMRRDIDYTYIVLLLGSLIIQSAAEEVLCRGFLMKSLAKRISMPLAIAISSTAFAYPHFATLFEAETEFAIIGTINLYLVSTVFSLLVITRSNIWTACGLHGIWNFLLYGVFGLALSGSEQNTTGILCFEANTPSILNGGIYGIEASIITTIILIIAVIILYRYWNTGKNIREKNGI